MVEASTIPSGVAGTRKADLKYRRRDQIIKTATGLFSKKSYHDVTMGEIADKMGVAKGTIYNYFSSKEKLYLEILQNSFEAIEGLLQEEMDNDAPAPEKLRKLLATIFIE